VQAPGKEFSFAEKSLDLGQIAGTTDEDDIVKMFIAVLQPKGTLP
jgi:hypothetical protein